MAATHDGGCLCGEVRFRVAGPPKWTGLCHCQSCRRHAGAPVSAFAGFEKPAVVFTHGEPTWYASSPGVRRAFCARCGSTLAYEGDRWPSETHVHVGAFDDPNAFPPKGEGFEEERLAWLHISTPHAT
jgi:hypothetical protein